MLKIIKRYACIIFCVEKEKKKNILKNKEIKKYSLDLQSFNKKNNFSKKFTKMRSFTLVFYENILRANKKNQK